MAALTEKRQRIRKSASSGRHDLLKAYTEEYGDALRRQQSAVALRAARVDAELAYQARGTFLASMNHELRTPLNAISGFAGLLKQADELNMTKEKREEYLDYILQSSDLLLSHINTILEIADAESGGMTIARRAFDIGDVIQQVTEDMIAHEGIDDVTIILDAPKDIPPVDADPDKIAIALKHLVHFLRGAEDQRAEEVVLKISIRPGLSAQGSSYIYVAVEANGAQHPMSEISAALRIFERVHEGLDRQFHKHRLGLPIAKSYIELNSGKFNIKPLSDERTLIRFALPIAQEGHQQTFERLAS